MAKSDNTIKLHRLLRRSRYPVSIERICEELQCSQATAHRAIHSLRNDKHAPLQTSRDPTAYFYSNEAFELEGTWLTPSELLSVVALQELLQKFEPQLFGKLLLPFRDKVEALLQSHGLAEGGVQRIRLLRMATRPTGPCFAEIVEATLQRRRLSIGYSARSTGETTERVISPQRLVHYRDKWYLDAWCHRQDALRIFSVDRINPAKVLETPALDISEAELDAALIHGYGIYSGAKVVVARLLFSAESARWVADEIWHPAQTGRFLESGEYLLEIPYSNPQELILDILRYGPDVEVLDPPELRMAVAQRLRAAAEKYF
jgi:predicted DNA-binding transcriptional regulator YafY